MKILALIGTFLISLHALAATNMTSSVLNASGGRASSGSTFNLVSATGQSGGVKFSSSGNTALYAGFLGNISLRPALDTDGDGIENELDLDNDGDTLSDLSELDGSAFSGQATTDPNLVDTDGDGMNDAAEASGMYDPNDPNHLLVITDFYVVDNTATLVWIGKGGGTINTILTCQDLVQEELTNLVYSAPYAGGSFPWFKTTNTYIWTESEPIGFYRVETLP